MAEISELLPCPLCSEAMTVFKDSFIHPANDHCPLNCAEFPLNQVTVSGWNRRAEARQAPLPAGTVTDALLRDLEEISSAVFGDLGSDPDVYADHDRLSALSGKMRRAIATIEAAFAARPAEPVAVKGLEWRYYPDAFPPMWVSQNASFSHYSIEEAAGSDSPTYDVLNPTMGLIANVDGLPEAKAAAQADYEARIRSTLISAPAPGLVEALRAARPIVEGLISAEYNVETWGLRQRLSTIDAALASITETGGAK